MMLFLAKLLSKPFDSFYNYIYNIEITIMYF